MTGPACRAGYVTTLLLSGRRITRIENQLSVKSVPRHVEIPASYEDFLVLVVVLDFPFSRTRSKDEDDHGLRLRRAGKSVVKNLRENMPRALKFLGALTLQRFNASTPLATSLRSSCHWRYVSGRSALPPWPRSEPTILPRIRLPYGQTGTFLSSLSSAAPVTL